VATRWVIGLVRLFCRMGWLILPVVAAGMVHVLVLKRGLMGKLAQPVDGGLYCNGTPILGANKTWRGLLIMTIATSCFTRVQSTIEYRVRKSTLGASAVEALLPSWEAGAAVGLAYSLAELPNSFIKRRLGVVPGSIGERMPVVQYIVDQTDSVLGCLLVLRSIHRLRGEEAAAVFVLGTMIHIGVDQLLYGIGVKRHNG
jgi:hypothetical protein